MRQILFLLVLFSVFSCKHEQKVIKSNKKNIKVFVNGSQRDWGISPEINPDRLKVYCSKEKNKVVFQTDTDSATFIVGNKDTIRFKLILKSKDTANTEIIGIKELPNQITRDVKVYWLSQIWSETKYNFVNVDRLKFNLDSLYKSFIPKVLATQNDFEYFKTLQQFMASLHDGHSEVVWRTSPYSDYIPMILDDFNKKVYITSVRKIPEFDSTWVGAEILKIDDIPTSEYLEAKVFPYISASTEQHLWMQGNSKLMYDLIEQPFDATIKKLDGSIEKIKIQRNGEATRTPNDQYWGPKTTYSRNIVDLKWLENNIALVSFNRFTPEEDAIKQFDKVAKELNKAKGLIIDLRRNGGGSTLVAWHLQKYFTKENHFLNYAWETRINDGVRKANGNWQDEYKNYFLNKAYRFEKPETVTVSDTLKRIKCPTVILIGRFTFSAAEDFLVNIFEVPNRPKFIGEETAGSTGSPLVLPDFPGGGFARICTRRICYPISETRFVNSGVKPDIEVKQTIEDYLNGKDVVLDRAIIELKK
jgi:C-terminal processing protease CtpA/Prc